jgi:PadR family transcriptional regulator PadR
VTPGREPYLNRVELLQGTLDMLILQTLQWGAQHGYAACRAQVNPMEALRAE